MTPDQISLVRQSFAMAEPVSGQLAGMFYGRLFTIAPETKPLFENANMFSQGDKLMAMLKTVISLLDKPELLMPAAENLAVGHNDYGVRAEHYAPVGEALIWALETGMGESFGEDAKDAWSTAYAALSAAMIAASEAAAKEKAE
ncbi:MAG: globin domain-containing protein [Mangrovicoccus sp.]